MPEVLAGAGHLRQDQQPKERGGAVADGVPAGQQSVEGGYVVENEEEIPRKEEDVVEEVDEEVRGAEFEGHVVWIGVRWSESGRRVGDRENRHENRRSSMEEGDETAGGLRAVGRTPVAEEGEEAEEVDGAEEEEK